MPYCTDPVFVVPLAEALRARGYGVEMYGYEDGWTVVIRQPAPPGAMAYGDADETRDTTLPACLAKAAARAVGTENDK